MRFPLLLGRWARLHTHTPEVNNQTWRSCRRKNETPIVSYLHPKLDNNIIQHYFQIWLLLPPRMATYPKIPVVIKTSQRWPRLRVKVNTSIPISVRRYMAKVVCLWRNGAHTGNNNVKKVNQESGWMTLAFMKLLGMSVRIIKQTINIHNMIKSSNLKRMQRTESTVQVKIEDCYFCTESLSLEGFGPVEPNATQEWRHNPSEDKSQAHSPSILFFALRGETPAFKDLHSVHNIAHIWAFFLILFYLDLCLYFLLCISQNKGYSENKERHIKVVSLMLQGQNLQDNGWWSTGSGGWKWCMRSRLIALQVRNREIKKRTLNNDKPLPSTFMSISNFTSIICAFVLPICCKKRKL